MKVTIRIIAGLLITFLCITKIDAQTFLSEGFEGTASLHTPPANWIPNTQSDFWYFQNGGWDQFTGYHHPATAHTGSYNAMFKTFGNATSKLVSPTIDLRYSIKPVLTFWHAQELRGTINDKLKVFYRTSPSSPDWMELDNYVNPTSGWVQRLIILPDSAKTQYCQIAFEGSSQNVSWGVCIDDIKLEEKGTLPRQLQSLSLIQNNSYIPSGSSTNPIGVININISGNTGNITTKSISIEYTGTDINDLNINSSELFYTRDSIFSPEIKLSPTIGNTGNTITFSNINYDLQTGENYIWVCTSIKSTAIHNNTADFKLLQNSVNIGDVLFPGGILDPTGFSTIEESLLFDGFESSTGWQYSSGSCWQMGTQTGTGTGDPDFAYSGQKVLATNLSGNYPASIQPSNPHIITSPSINAKFYQNINIRFKRWLNFEFFDKTSIQSSIDGGTTWNKVWENSTTIQDQNWKNISYSINQATRKQDVKIRFSLDTTDLTGLFGGWNIDNFAVTGDFIARDLGISGINAPVTHCGMTNAETVTIKIKNYGGASVSGPFDVGFSLDNGAHYTKETISSATTINSEQEISYTFNPSTANLSQFGLKQLKFKTFLTGDEDLSNDLFSTNLFVYPTLSYIYQNSFESSNGYWNPSGTNSTWAWGIPAATKIDTASNGTKVWVTNLKGSHANSEVSYLESPCFNFTGSEYPVLSFDYWVNAENGVDGFRLDYSINGGTTWNPVPANSNHTQNWCTGTTVTSLGTDGWTGITSSGYVTAKTLLPTNVNGVNGVKFRFYFASDAANNYEGVAIDNIKIYELPYDVGVESLTSPITGCLIGNNVKLVASVKNFGYRPLKVGLKVPMEIKLRSESVVKDTLVIASIVNKNGSANFTSTGNYNIFTKGTHSLRMNTNFATELSRTNDTLKTTLEVRGIPGYSLGTDKALPNLPPISVSLDGKLNGATPFNSYAWSAVPTPTYPTPTLTPPTNVRTVTATDFGTYSVVVTNENGCTATDAINVIPSNYDVQIMPPAIGISDNCTYPTSVKPEITIQNNGPGNIPVGYKIPLSITVDGVIKVSDTLVVGSQIDFGSSTSYTFTAGINISIPNTYSINIFSSVNDDENKNNDTLKTTTHVWGLPDVNILQVQDTIVNLNASTITLDAGAGFATYKWQDNSTNQTFAITSNTSAWYKVTVTDSHSCGSDKDSVYLNAKDLSIASIENPSTSFCDNESSHVAVLVNNSGRDDILAGSKITVNYVTPNESVTQKFTLETALPSGSSKTLTFDNAVDMPIGNGFIRAEATIVDDPTKSNNVIERSFNKNLGPTVSFNPSILAKVFGTEIYYVKPSYSSDVKSFLWKDSGYVQDLSLDSLFSITGTPPSNVLHVIAFDKKNQAGCRDTASLTIIAEDIAVDAIKSPTSQCVLGNSIPIIITIANKGNFIYPAGTEYTIGINVDGYNYPNELKSLLAPLAPEGKIDITLNPILDLSLKSSSNIQISITTSLDAVSSNNSLNKVVYATGYPTVDLGSDRTLHAWSDTLRAGKSYNLYAWTCNTTPKGSDSTLIATQTGTYSVKVTDFNGCSSTDDIVLTFVVDDISLKTLNKPVTGCGLNDTEYVQVAVKNEGTTTIPTGTVLALGFIQNGITQKENFTLTDDLTSGQPKVIDISKTMDFSTKKLYPIKAWVIMDGDMRNNNDTLSTSVDAYPPALFTFGTNSIVSETSYTLDAGAGFSSYLWSTGGNTQSILVTTTGDYWVEVTNSYGCSARDTVHVKIGTRDVSVKSLIAPQAVNCSLSGTETITVRLENSGTNEIPSGTVIELALKINTITVATESYTLSSNLTIGSTTDYSFIYKPNLSAPSAYAIEIVAQMADDEVLTNNSIQQSVIVYGTPTPNLGADRDITSATELKADPGYTSYLWSTGETTQAITVNATGTYSVTVTDSNGCQGSDEVTLTWQEVSDVRITQLISPLVYPLTNCFNSQGQTVTATFTNEGTRTFNPGESINVSYQVDASTPVVETMKFESSIANGQSINYTFNQKAPINPGSVLMVLKTIVSGVEGIASDSYPITINANPTLDLGPDTIKTDLPITIKSGVAGVTYLWSDGTTDPTLTVTSYGKYWLTITKTSTGCINSDTVVVTSLNDVEIIPGTNAKVTLFPNPVRNELNITIETDKDEVFTIDLVSPTGQVVKNLKTNKTSNFNDKISVNGYAPGVYFIRVSNSKGSAVFKVVVEK